ncbi:MAG: hypothetical protein WAU91_20370, partial [Desulfatitalea sp.]
MVRKKIQIFISAIIVMLIASTASAGERLFFDNYESASLSGYTAVNAQISSDVAYSGSRSVRVTHSGTAMLRKDLDMATMLEYNEITIRYRWYTSTSWASGTGVKYARLRTPSQELQSELWFSENLGTEPLGLGGLHYGSASLSNAGFPGSGQSYNKGRWMLIEIHYIYNTPGQNNGLMEVSFDGVRKIHNTAVGFRNRSDIAFNQFYLPSNIGTSNSSCINYIDDMEIWEGTPDGSSPTPTPNPTPTPTPIPGNVSQPAKLGMVSWSANSQTGDTTWSDSTALWCVRALVNSESLQINGNNIVLGFQGRGSSSYIIRKVSIAEKDSSGAQGNVVNSTWKRVTFDNRSESTWSSDTITVPAGQVKRSNSIPFVMDR